LIFVLFIHYANRIKKKRKFVKLYSRVELNSICIKIIHICFFIILSCPSDFHSTRQVHFFIFIISVINIMDMQAIIKYKKRSYKRVGIKLPHILCGGRRFATCIQPRPVWSSAVCPRNVFHCICSPGFSTKSREIKICTYVVLTLLFRNLSKFHHHKILFF
jgi:hypothetical protein